jgi:hypothetical protein
MSHKFPTLGTAGTTAGVAGILQQQWLVASAAARLETEAASMELSQTGFHITIL